MHHLRSILSAVKWKWHQMLLRNAIKPLIINKSGEKAKMKLSWSSPEWSHSSHLSGIHCLFFFFLRSTDSSFVSFCIRLMENVARFRASTCWNLGRLTSQFSFITSSRSLTLHQWYVRGVFTLMRRLKGLNIHNRVKDSKKRWTVVCQRWNHAEYLQWLMFWFEFIGHKLTVTCFLWQLCYLYADMHKHATSKESRRFFMEFHSLFLDRTAVRRFSVFLHRSFIYFLTTVLNYLWMMSLLFAPRILKYRCRRQSRPSWVWNKMLKCSYFF